MSATEMTHCVLCFQPVLGCSECTDCDANRYCPGHYFWRARQRGELHFEGDLADMLRHLHEREFVEFVNLAVAEGFIQTAAMRPVLPRSGK